MSERCANSRPGKSSCFRIDASLAADHHRPQLSDLRESGALEQDADVVIFIFREEEYNATPDNRGIAELIIGKQRNGPTGNIKMAFIKEYTRFENLEWRHDEVI